MFPCSPIGMEWPMPNILGGPSPCLRHPNGEKKGLLMGMMPKLKTVSNLPLGFTECGMSNANNLILGLPPACHLQMVRKVYLFKGMAQG